MKAKSQQTAVDWTRAKVLHESLKAHGRRFLVNRILLGKELASLKKKLGFVNGRNQWVRQIGGPSKTWGEWCADELGVPDRTADRWIQCFAAAVQRAKFPNTKAKFPQAARLLQMPAAEMDGSEVDELSACVERLLDLEMIITQQDLLEDMGIKRQKLDSPKNKDGASPNPKGDPHKVISSAYFGDLINRLNALTKQVVTTRDRASYKALLSALPLNTPDPTSPCLQGIKEGLVDIMKIQTELLHEDLPKIIADIDEAIERKMQGEAPKRVRKSTTIRLR